MFTLALMVQHDCLQLSMICLTNLIANHRILVKNPEGRLYIKNNLVAIVVTIDKVCVVRK